ncbi:glycosyltransferase family 32 protein [Salipiger aestuarii]|uniref:glycosyltransferase family 32 protein n=1 Tax=Salipiger aestuarii TaxID=568098 RepID=UPI0037C74FAC
MVPRNREKFREMKFTDVDEAGRNIFYFWDHPETMPNIFQENILASRCIHYNWKVHVINDEMAQEIIGDYDPLLLEAYQMIRIPACRSDLVRLVLLLKYGGWYLDCDIYPNKAVDYLGTERPLLFRRDDDGPEQSYGRVTNMAMFLPKEHSLALDALSVIKNYIREKVHLHNVFLFSGPGLITAISDRNGVFEENLLSFQKYFRGGARTFRTTKSEATTSWMATQSFGIFDDTEPRYPRFPKKIDEKAANIIVDFVKKHNLKKEFEELLKRRKVYLDEPVIQKYVDELSAKSR